MRREEAITILHEALPGLRERFKVPDIALFGSVARDEAGPDSDVDIMVTSDAVKPLVRLHIKKEIIRFGGVLALLLLNLNCIPVPVPGLHSYTYNKINYKGALRLRDHGSEAYTGRPESPGFIFFRYFGIRISAILQDGFIQIGYHIAKGHIVRIKEKDLELESFGNNKLVRKIKIEPSRPMIIGDRLLMVYPETFGTEDFFGDLVGDNRKSSEFIPHTCVKRYTFIAGYSENEFKDGKVKLPNMIIDGIDRDGPVLRFEHVTETFLNTKVVLAL